MSNGVTEIAGSASVPVLGRWDGGSCPFDTGWRKLMMWVFIVGDGLIFAGFLAAFGFARAMTAEWPDQSQVFHLSLIALMTFVLITSSATMASAVGSARNGDLAGASKWVLLTLVGGALFLGIQAYEWTTLIGEGARLNHNPWGVPLFGAYFFLITGFHGFHVLTGVVVLATLMRRLSKGVATGGGVELAGLYWHFIDLVWVFVFTCFYLL